LLAGPAGIALLNQVLSWAHGEGYERCAVDWEPMNVLATRFWTRHFQPVSYALVRHIDERFALPPDPEGDLVVQCDKAVPGNHLYFASHADCATMMERPALSASMSRSAELHEILATQNRTPVTRTFKIRAPDVAREANRPPSDTR
jgi:hypothetical protein